MNPVELYRSKQKIKFPLIDARPRRDLEFIVVIPSYNEPDLEPCLDSLESAALTARVVVEIIIIINESEQSGQSVKNQNRITYSLLESRPHRVPVYTLLVDSIPTKKAGVGYARKLGMDEAVYRFESIGTPDGVICSMDADTKVQANYFSAIKQAKVFNDWECLSIHFEHDLSTIRDSRHLKAIADYELHLRYYVMGLRYAGFPHSFQTLGSAIAFRALAYAEVGGMPARQAGEDFYFVHKFSKRGKVARLGSTTVYPSARLSDRVPFGTGRALIESLARPEQIFHTYAWQSFIELRSFLNSVDLLYLVPGTEDLNLSHKMLAFLELIQFEKILKEIKRNTGSTQTFRKRFFHQLDAFTMMKYVHFMRDQYYANEPLTDASNQLLKVMEPYSYPIREPINLLEKFRDLERTGSDLL